jgi:thiol-disulfide isomerase/thioredoxin
VLLSTFTVAIAVNLARGRTPDCRCFGQVRARPIGPGTLVRNLILVGIAAVLVTRGQTTLTSDSLGAYDIGQVTWLWIALAVAVGGGLFMLLQLLRQYGRLLLRVEALEARTGDAAPADVAGLPRGTRVPPVTLRSLTGKQIQLTEQIATDALSLLVFVEPGCAACDELRDDLRLWAVEHEDKLRVLVISGGTAEANRAKYPGLPADILLQTDREVAALFKTEATPSAVLVRNGTIASHLAVGPDPIRALVDEATAPPPLTVGQRIEAPRASLLDSGTLDLATLRERTLLLFWNPQCGFCQQMLPDVQRWQRRGSGDAMFVISTGSLEGIRQQGFTSRVAVDPAFVIGRRFGVNGTPSALLIENGRVASDVAVGADAIWELARSIQAASMHADTRP